MALDQIDRVGLRAAIPRWRLSVRFRETRQCPILAQKGPQSDTQLAQGNAVTPSVRRICSGDRLGAFTIARRLTFGDLLWPRNQHAKPPPKPSPPPRRKPPRRRLRRRNSRPQLGRFVGLRPRYDLAERRDRPSTV